MVHKTYHLQFDQHLYKVFFYLYYFVILDCRDGKHVSHNAAKEISDRKFGVGCDQIIVIKKPII